MNIIRVFGENFGRFKVSWKCKSLSQLSFSCRGTQVVMEGQADQANQESKGVVGLVVLLESKETEDPLEREEKQENQAQKERGYELNTWLVFFWFTLLPHVSMLPHPSHAHIPQTTDYFVKSWLIIQIDKTCDLGSHSFYKTCAKVFCWFPEDTLIYVFPGLLNKCFTSAYFDLCHLCITISLSNMTGSCKWLKFWLNKYRMCKYQRV